MSSLLYVLLTAARYWRTECGPRLLRLIDTLQWIGYTPVGHGEPLGNLHRLIQGDRGIGSGITCDIQN